MNIDDLLEKYFDGNTSHSEETALRQYFRSNNIPERLEPYRPMFAYFDKESERRQQTAGSIPPARKPLARKAAVRWSVAAAVAILAVVLAQRLIPPAADPCICSAHYVIINGQCFTDADKARSMALEALRDMAAPARDLFPENNFLEDDFFETDLIPDL
ncbi:MAG: hypothetical protein LBC81_05770 [Tannerellaceae bacterium]|jgi:hypothetical protein|nr:hypothetical protein [Tannerellaceae bacterium]